MNVEKTSNKNRLEGVKIKPWVEVISKTNFLRLVFFFFKRHICSHIWNVRSIIYF